MLDLTSRGTKSEKVPGDFAVISTSVEFLIYVSIQPDYVVNKMTLLQGLGGFWSKAVSIQ